MRFQFVSMSKHPISYDAALHKCAAYCSLSEHCIDEVHQKMELWGVEEQDRKRIIAYLVKEKYIDESRYAKAFARDKFRYGKWGRIKIGMALRNKRIDSDLINSALDAIDSDEYTAMIDRLIQEKLRGLRFQNEYEKQGKLIRFLAGKGFEPGEIMKRLRL